jgi:hypothetical protein
MQPYSAAITEVSVLATTSKLAIDPHTVMFTPPLWMLETIMNNEGVDDMSAKSR